MQVSRGSAGISDRLHRRLLGSPRAGLASHLHEVQTYATERVAGSPPPRLEQRCWCKYRGRGFRSPAILPAQRQVTEASCACVNFVAVQERPCMPFQPGHGLRRASLLDDAAANLRPTASAIFAGKWKCDLCRYHIELCCVLQPVVELSASISWLPIFPELVDACSKNQPPFILVKSLNIFPMRPSFSHLKRHSC